MQPLRTGADVDVMQKIDILVEQGNIQDAVHELENLGIDLCRCAANIECNTVSLS